MEVGIIVYSQTGNTHSVAEILKKKFSEAGDAAKVERITVRGESGPGSKEIQFENIPDTALYDAIVFAAPVQAFSLSSPMNAYLEQLSSLRGKKIACYVTKQLPGKWTGGNRALARMKQICKAKGGTVLGSEVIVWNKRRDRSIAVAVERLISCFGASSEI